MNYDDLLRGVTLYEAQVIFRNWNYRHTSLLDKWRDSESDTEKKRLMVLLGELYNRLEYFRHLF